MKFFIGDWRNGSSRNRINSNFILFKKLELFGTLLHYKKKFYTHTPPLHTTRGLMVKFYQFFEGGAVVGENWSGSNNSISGTKKVQTFWAKKKRTTKTAKCVLSKSSFQQPTNLFSAQRLSSKLLF